LSHTRCAQKAGFQYTTHDTLGIIPLVAGVVTTLCTSAKNSVQKLTDYTKYDDYCVFYGLMNEYHDGLSDEGHWLIII